MLNLRWIIVPGLLLICTKSAIAEQPALQWENLHKVDGVEYFRGIDVLDDGKTVWVTGTKGTVMRTNDGGESWVRLAVPGNLDEIDVSLRDVELFSESEAFVISSGDGADSRIYYTQDGGSTWTLQHQNEYESGFYNAMAWWDRQKGFVFSDPVDGYVLVLRTIDGGKTWQESGGPNGKQLAHKNNLRATDGEQGFAASGTSAAAASGGIAWILTANGAESRVHITRDFGVTWTLSNPPIDVTNSSSGPFAAALLDENHGIVVGGDFQNRQGRYPNIAITRDGGTTWVRPDKSPTGHRSSVHYLTDKIVVTIGSHGTDYSTDGGMTWTNISDEGFYTSVAYGRTIWAAGSEGRIARIDLSGI